MKKILILFLFVSPLLNGQTLTHEKLYRNLKTYSSLNSISFYSPENHNKREFYFIDLITKNGITEPPEYEVYKKKLLMNNLTTDSIAFKKIIELLDSKGFLEKLYIRVDCSYVNVDSTSDRVSDQNLKLAIELFCSEKKGFNQIFIPIKENTVAIEILQNVSNIFDKNEQKLFKEMIIRMK